MTQQMPHLCLREVDLAVNWVDQPLSLLISQNYILVVHPLL